MIPREVTASFSEMLSFLAYSRSELGSETTVAQVKEEGEAGEGRVIVLLPRGDVCWSGIQPCDK